MKLRGNKLTAAVKLCFAAAVILALSTGFVRAVFFPKDVNEYESRMANQLPAFTAGAFADSSFQNGAEDALSDQLPLSTYLKRLIICSAISIRSFARYRLQDGMRENTSISRRRKSITACLR